MINEKKYDMVHIIKKKILFLLYGAYVKVLERTYKDSNHKIKYILRRNKQSKDLLVVFSAFGDNKPHYNYMRTLRKQKINKLNLKLLGYLI